MRPPARYDERLKIDWLARCFGTLLVKPQMALRCRLLQRVIPLTLIEKSDGEPVIEAGENLALPVLHMRSPHAWARTLCVFSSSPSGGVWLVCNKHSAPFSVATPIVW